MRHFVRWIALAILPLLAGCATHDRYTSLDLDLLPCEHGQAPRFFQSVEFLANGTPRYPQQLDRLEDILKNGFRRSAEDRPTAQPTEIIVFVHGWSKNPSSAEGDYQDFICRLHGKLRGAIADQKAEGRLLVIGVFWPSTITNRAKEPLLVKPRSYFVIRNRADHIARTGLYQLLQKLSFQRQTEVGKSNIHMQLIGHSFGGRMLVEALAELEHEGQLEEFLQSSGDVNIVLLNAAIAPSRFKWITEAIARSDKGRPNRSPGVSDERNASSYLFNVHSLNDSATRKLFPIASLFNDDPAVCAAGACGVPSFETIELDESGSMVLSRGDNRLRCSHVSVEGWNIDATKVVFSHSDIYKGRIAGLLSELTYGKDTRANLAGHQGGTACVN